MEYGSSSKFHPQKIARQFYQRNFCFLLFFYKKILKML
ncbi:hypothetical protein HSIEG1_3885 [Enterococcus sp. HSIEG1]|nr:hypothetical protein HSIEG1_3885 [Enterococcus sp. HSIEG1]